MDVEGVGADLARLLRLSLLRQGGGEVDAGQRSYRRPLVRGLLAERDGLAAVLLRRCGRPSQTEQVPV